SFNEAGVDRKALEIAITQVRSLQVYYIRFVYQLEPMISSTQLLSGGNVDILRSNI
ncbi:15897_t:CDS:1, partial [Acaulospora morrowiae]